MGWPWRSGVGLALLILTPASASADPLEVRSRHERLAVEGEGRSQTYHWLKPEEVMQLDVRGPTNVGLQLRKITGADAPPGCVDLTVVQDEREQGTVRFRRQATRGWSATRSWR